MQDAVKMATSRKRKEEAHALKALQQQVASAGEGVLEKGALCLLAAAMLRHGVLDGKKHAALLALVQERDVAVVRALRTYSERGANEGGRKRRQIAANELVDDLVASATEPRPTQLGLSTGASEALAVPSAERTASPTPAQYGCAAAAAGVSSTTMVGARTKRRARPSAAAKQARSALAAAAAPKEKAKATAPRRQPERSTALVPRAAARPAARPAAKAVAARLTRRAALAQTKKPARVTTSKAALAASSVRDADAPDALSPPTAAVLSILQRLAESRALLGVRADGIGMRTRFESLEVALVSSDIEMRSTLTPGAVCAAFDAVGIAIERDALAGLVQYIGFNVDAECDAPLDYWNLLKRLRRVMARTVGTGSSGGIASFGAAVDALAETVLSPAHASGGVRAGAGAGAGAGSPFASPAAALEASFGPMTVGEFALGAEAQEERTLRHSFGGARERGFGDGDGGVGGGLNIDMLTSATRPLERARDAQHAEIIGAIQSSDRAADTQWRQWAELNLERGCTVDGIRKILTERGGYGFKSEGRKSSRSPPRPRKAPQPHPRSARKQRGAVASNVVLG